MSVTINMPQMAANGLSENWLFRHAGDLHWQALCASLDVASGSLLDDEGHRVYPTFVAISGRYGVPLSAVEENEVFDGSVQLSHFGRSFFHGAIRLANNRAAFELEMLTAFAARDASDRNDLRKSTPTSTLRYTTSELRDPPPILLRAKSMRRREVAEYELGAHRFTLGGAGAIAPAPIDYEPSPYHEFNGANLLYFASYPTIVDTLERQMIGRDRLAADAGDWALAASTVARDVFYYRNLDIGQSVRVRLRAFDRVGDTVYLHTTMSTVDDEEPLSDVFTAKRLLTQGAV